MRVIAEVASRGARNGEHQSETSFGEHSVTRSSSPGPADRSRGTRTALLAVSLLACVGGPSDLERVIELQVEARGGREAIEAVHSMRVELHLVEPTFEADLVYRAMRPYFARVDVTIDGRVVFTEALNVAGAWQQGGPEAPVETTSPEGTRALRNGAVGNLYGLHELRDLGYALELLEPETIEGIEHVALEITAPDGEGTTLYLDPATWLVARTRDFIALHPDVDPTERRIEGRVSDYRRVDGLMRAFRSEEWDLETGERMQAIEVQRIEHNPKLDEAIFERPRPRS